MAPVQGGVALEQQDNLADLVPHHGQAGELLEHLDGLLVALGQGVQIQAAFWARICLKAS